MNDRIYITFGLGDFNTSPGGVLKVVDNRVVLDREKTFNRFRRMLNCGANTIRVLRRGIWGVKKPFDFEDEGYWPVFREFIELIHSPYQGVNPPGGADVWVEIFDGCSEDWMYDPANRDRARKLIQQMFSVLGGLPYVKFGVGNEVSSQYARAFVRELVYPEFKAASRVPFAYGASYIRQNPPGSTGPLEWQKYEAEAAWDEQTALSIYRPVHSVKDATSMNLIDTVKYWVDQGNPICVQWSVDGVWDGGNLCDRTVYNGQVQARPSPFQIKSAMDYWMNAVQKWNLSSGQVKYGFEHIPKVVNEDECASNNITAISEAYNARFGNWPANYGKYPNDWVDPIPPTPPDPPTPDCKCRYWLEKGGDGKRDWKRWFDCVFGDGPKRCK